MIPYKIINFNHMKFKILIFLLLLYSCSSEFVSWPESTPEAKPWTRWWWLIY